MRKKIGKLRRSGANKVSVPSLSGLTRSQAQSALAAVGLGYSESTTGTSNSGLTDYVESQGSSSGATVLRGSTISFVYYTYVPTITYGACEAYGSGTETGNGTQCSSTYYQSYTDYSYNTRKKIYSDGAWDGASYTTSGCGTTSSRSVTSSGQVDGLCGYTPPCTISSYSGYTYSGITWSGSCPSGTESGTATNRSRTDNCGNTYNESGSYAQSRSCTVAETWGPCQSYTFTQPTCNGEDSYVGNYTGYRKTSNLGNTTTAGCASATFTSFGDCLYSNGSGCGGTNANGPCYTPPPSGPPSAPPAAPPSGPPADCNTCVSYGGACGTYGNGTLCITPGSCPNLCQGDYDDTPPPSGGGGGQDCTPVSYNYENEYGDYCSAMRNPCTGALTNVSCS